MSETGRKSDLKEVVSMVVLYTGKRLPVAVYYSSSSRQFYCVQKDVGCFVVDEGLSVVVAVSPYDADERMRG